MSFKQHYPIVYNALKKIKHDAVPFGEVVILNEKGKLDFQKLQYYLENTTYPTCNYVFDLLSLNGKDTCGSPLTERKKILKQLLKKTAVIKYSDHVLEKGKSFFNAAVKQNLEGIDIKSCLDKLDVQLCFCFKKNVEIFPR